MVCLLMGKQPPVVDNKTLTNAYELSVKMENDLLPRYEWLVKKAEDRDTAQVLNAILIQSRWHLVMFDHALEWVMAMDTAGDQA